MKWSINEDVEETEPSYFTGDDANCFNHCGGNTFWQFHKKLNIELSYNSAILLLDIYLKEWKESSQMFLHDFS